MNKQQIIDAFMNRATPLVCLEQLELVECEEGRVVMKTPVTQTALNINGNAHGGWLFAFCDDCAGLAADFLGVPTVTQQASINYLRAAKPGDTVTAKVQMIHKGRRTLLNRVDLFNQKDQLLVTASFTMFKLGTVE